MTSLRSVLRVLACGALVCAGTACASAPPTGWQTGGTQLTVPRARWVAGDVLVDLDHEGKIEIGGKHILTVDRAGRVYDAYNQPVALLDGDGMLYGEDDKPLGWVGAGEAILPGEDDSWLRFDASGLVLRIDGDGDQRPFGQWMGCNHPQVIQTCTLITHLIGQDLMQRQRNRSRVGIGIGIGIGVGP